MNQKQQSGNMHILSNRRPGGLPSRSAPVLALLTGALLALIITGCSLRGRSQMEAQAPLPAADSIEPAGIAETIGVMPAEGVPPTFAAQYRLTTGDQLQVRFPELKNLDFPAVVRPDGYITTPRTGDMPAMGWTPTQLADSIAAAYGREFRSPRATVQVTGFGPQHFYVFGEVKNPNRYTLDQPMELIGAITRAGGFLRSAVPGNIVVVKVSPDGRYAFSLHDLNDILEQTSPPYWLEANDIVIVPKSAISNAADFVRDYVMTFIAPIDAFLRGRYYWQLVQDNTQ
jgi:protein involved in polysaccharide export with SLBB domain